MVPPVSVTGSQMEAWRTTSSGTDLESFLPRVIRATPAVESVSPANHYARWKVLNAMWLSGNPDPSASPQVAKARPAGQREPIAKVPSSVKDAAEFAVFGAEPGSVLPAPVPLPHLIHAFAEFWASDSEYHEPSSSEGVYQ